MWSGGISSAWTTGTFIGIVLWSTVAIVFVVLYLAAAAFAMRIRNVIRSRRYTSLEATWEPVLLDVIDGSEPAAALHAAVAKRSIRHFLKFLVRYARLLTGSDRANVVEIAAEYLPVMIKDLSARRPATRALAVQTLATLGMESYGATIARALDDKSPLVSMVAARTLSASRRPEYVNDVLANLHRYSSWNGRFLASMLASMGPEVAPSLRAYLHADGDPLDRSVAADALSLLTDPAAGDVATAVLQTAPHRELAAASLRLLRSVGSPEHLPTVRDYGRSRDFVLRALAMRVLGSIGEAADMVLLEKGMMDLEPWVAINSAEAMLEAGGHHRLHDIAESELPQASLAREVMMEEVA
ncbi:MAG: HEAT repeat domain-containing protein [Acidimicrobiia bacterium]